MKTMTTDLWRAFDLMDRMKACVAVLRDEAFEHALEGWNRRSIDRIDDDFSRRDEGGLSSILEDLDSELIKSGYDVDNGSAIDIEFRSKENWYIQSRLDFRDPIKIFRGFLVPVIYVPDYLSISRRVFAFLKINGDHDLLDRDNGFSGIHYHYVLANRKRTTTVICWDTRWVSSDKTDAKGVRLRPIFHELHGEGSYTRRARPEKWGDKKRESIRKACIPDLQKFDLQAFRCASSKANAVWPVSAVLTPRGC